MIFLVADVYVYVQLSIPYGYVSRGHCGLLPESAWKWYKQKHWRPHYVKKSQWFRNPAITNWDVQNLVTNGINYQPQMVNAGFLSWLAGFLNHQHYDGNDFEGPLTVQGMWGLSLCSCRIKQCTAHIYRKIANSMSVCNSWPDSHFCWRGIPYWSQWDSYEFWHLSTRFFFKGTGKPAIFVVFVQGNTHILELELEVLWEERWAIVLLSHVGFVRGIFGG